MNVVHATSGASLRSIDLRKVQSVVVQVASAKNRFFFMLRLPREYDLVGCLFSALWSGARGNKRIQDPIEGRKSCFSAHVNKLLIAES